MNRSNDRSDLPKSREKTIRILVVLLIIIAALFVYMKDREKDEGFVLSDSTAGQSSSLSIDANASEVICDVCGAVAEPQVVELEAGSRIADAIEAAGGLTETADVTNINRAAVVNDGDKIYIPEQGEAAAQGSSPPDGTAAAPGTAGVSPPAGTSQQGGKININTADSTALQTITGVGPVTAQKIIQYRTDNGSFRKIEDIQNVSGIGEKTFEKMKDSITI